MKPGDWVRFARDGRIITGVVEYVKKAPNGRGENLFTDVGYVTSEQVLESRSVAPGEVEAVRGKFHSLNSYYMDHGAEVVQVRLDALLPKSSVDAFRKLIEWLA